MHPEPNGNGHRHLPEPAIGPETGIAARLSDSLRLTNGFRDRATNLLPRVSLCFLAEDRAAAQRLAIAYPHLYFLLPDGVCYHGHTVTGGKKTGAGPLAMKREARELAATLKPARTASKRCWRAWMVYSRKSSAWKPSWSACARCSSPARRIAWRSIMTCASWPTTCRAPTRASPWRVWNSSACAATPKNRPASARRTAPRSKRRSGCAPSAKKRWKTERQELEKLEGRAATVGEEHAATRAELAGLEERHRGERSAMARLEQQFRETTNRRNAIAPEIERLGESRARLLADNIELDKKATLLAGEIASLDARVNEMARRDSGLREALRAGEEELKALRLASETLHEKRSQIEVDLVRKQAELKYLDETSRKELNCPVDSLAASDDPVPDADTIAEAEQCCNEVRNRIEALGPVNAAAMEEYQEAQQRQEFLSAQRQDLIDSIRDTEKAIQEIDQVSRQKFAEAFEAINTNFRGIFQTLFGGGTGEMRLTDQENLAESGIEIVCSPPGKRLQNVLLLSGGEKALAAVALLMAIFRYQPSPFCVMDEVDAPLDESNIGRLTRLLTGNVQPDPVRGDHPFQADHGIGPGAVRGDDAGAGRLPAGLGEVPRGDGGRSRRMTHRVTDAAPAGGRVGVRHPKGPRNRRAFSRLVSVKFLAETAAAPAA